MRNLNALKSVAIWSLAVSGMISPVASAEALRLPASATYQQTAVKLRFQKDVLNRSFEQESFGATASNAKTEKSRYMKDVALLMNEPIVQNRKTKKLAESGAKSEAALFYLLDGAELASPTSDEKYNVTIEGYMRVDKDLAFVRIPNRLNDLLRETNACDVNSVGPCIVVDRDMKGSPEAFVVGSAVDEGKFKVFRKQIKKTKTNQYAINNLSESEASVMTVFSFAESQEAVDQMQDDMSGVGESQDSDEDRNATTQSTSSSGRTDELANEGEILTDESVIQQAEEEMARNFSRAPKAVFRKLHGDRQSKYGTCVVGGHLETKAIQILFVRVDFTEKVKIVLPSNDRPLMKGKGKLLCYLPDGSVFRKKIEAKLFSDLSIGAMMGRLYFGSVGLGFADSPLDLIRTKNADGTISQLYREWAFFPFLNVDAAYIVGVGGSAIGFSSGRYQKPILNLFTGRVGVGAIGARWGVFEKGRIGYDPDDL